MMAWVKINSMDFGLGKGWHFCRKCRGLKSYSFLLFIVVALTCSYSQAYEWKSRSPSSNVVDLRKSPKFSSFLIDPTQPYVGAGCLTYLINQTDLESVGAVSIYVAERMAKAIEEGQPKVTVPGGDVFRMGYNRVKLSVEVIKCLQEALAVDTKQSLSSSNQVNSKAITRTEAPILQQRRLQFLRDSELIHQIDTTEDELLRILNQDHKPTLNKPGHSRPVESNPSFFKNKESKRKGAIQ